MTTQGVEQQEWTGSTRVDGTGTVGPQQVDWSDLGREMWDFLTGRRAAINYEFQGLSVEVPRDTGPRAPRAVWRVDGTLRISTDDDRTRARS
jgi:hypothetical protein